MKRIFPGLLLAAALAGCGGGGGSESSNPTPNPSQAKWTVLVYVNAANDLSKYSDANVNQMERLANDPNVNVVVQWKKAKGWWDNYPTFTGTRRYLIKHDTTDAIASPVVQDLGANVDMGTAATLADFVAWGKAKYPSDHTMVILWDHGTGWQRTGPTVQTRSISSDLSTGSKIMGWDLANAFPTKVDVIATDACLMQMAELGYQLRSKCDYLVASEDLVPADGYAYDKMLAGIGTRADASAGGVATFMATTYADLNYSPYSDWAMQESVVATAKLPALVSALDILAGALIANKEALTTIVPAAREAALAYDPRYQRTYLDLVDIASRLAASSAPANVKSAATNVVNTAKAAVVTNGVNALGSGGHGIAIDFSPSSEFAGTYKEEDYANLDIAKDSRWEDWLRVAP